MLEGMILKPNMVLPGLTCATQETAEAVADATIDCLLRVVPAAVPGVAFLSGGQTSELASARLNAMNVRSKAPGSRLPWALAFSFARAIQQPALQIWRGEARTWRRRSRRCIIGPAATGRRVGANTVRRWKGGQVPILRLRMRDVSLQGSATWPLDGAATRPRS